MSKIIHVAGHTGHAALASAAERAIFGDPDMEDRIADVVDQHLERLDFLIGWTAKLKAAIDSVDFPHGEPPWLEDLNAGIEGFMQTNRVNYAAAVEDSVRGEAE